MNCWENCESAGVTAHFPPPYLPKTSGENSKDVKKREQNLRDLEAAVRKDEIPQRSPQETPRSAVCHFVHGAMFKFSVLRN